MSRWNRTNFVKKQIVDDKIEMQFVTEYFDECFIFNREVKYYALENSDIQHPDLLSIKLYGKQDYWWILCKVNQIYDIWNDIIPGKVIIIPDVRDIEDFYSNVAKKQRDENK